MIEKAAYAVVGEPLLTIIVPVYNSKKHLEQCVRSILSQTIKNFELILIDDGSTDGSENILRDLSQSHRRIRLIQNSIPSGSPGVPRNQALEVAKGKYVGFVDSDDWIEPDYFEDMLTLALNFEADIVYTSGFNSIREDKATVQSFYFPNDKRLSKYTPRSTIWDKIFRRSLLDKYKIRLAETSAGVDIPFVLKAFYHLPCQVRSKNEAGYNYRQESYSSVTLNRRRGSDCEFMLTVFKEIDSWSKGISTDYKIIVDFRKVCSYVYTLGVIDKKFFYKFYDYVYNDFLQLDNEGIKDIAIKTKRMPFYSRYADIVGGMRARDYMIKFNKSN